MQHAAFPMSYVLEYSVVTLLSPCRQSDPVLAAADSTDDASPRMGPCVVRTHRLPPCWLSLITSRPGSSAKSVPYSPFPPRLTADSSDRLPAINPLPHPLHPPPSPPLIFHPPLPPRLLRRAANRLAHPRLARARRAPRRTPISRLGRLGGRERGELGRGRGERGVCRGSVGRGGG